MLKLLETYLIRSYFYSNTNKHKKRKKTSKKKTKQKTKKQKKAKNGANFDLTPDSFIEKI